MGGNAIKFKFTFRNANGQEVDVIETCLEVAQRQAGADFRLVCTNIVANPVSLPYILKR